MSWKPTARAAASATGKVLSLSKRYGEMSYLYAMAFAQVGKTLTSQQKEKLARMRTANPSGPKGPFLYSSPIDMPKIESTDFLFGVRRPDPNAPSIHPGAQGK